MQISKKNTESDFQPFELTIKVETREEFELLGEISGYDETVPVALLNARVIDDNQMENLKSILRTINEILYS